MAKKIAEPKKPAINPTATAKPAPPAVLIQTPAAVPPEKPVPPAKDTPEVPKVVQGGQGVVTAPLALDLSELIATAPELPRAEQEIPPAPLSIRVSVATPAPPLPPAPQFVESPPASPQPDLPAEAIP
ncbi:MAG: hypothetical protein WBM15_07680, partial [Chromatiaceae bacterium]